MNIVKSLNITLLSLSLLQIALLTTAQAAQLSEPTTNTSQMNADTALTAQVNAALSGADTLKKAEIQVESRNGVVQLRGLVQSVEDIDTAVQLAKNVPGVSSVTNELRVR